MNEKIQRFFQHPAVRVTLYIIAIGLLTYLFLWRLWAAAPEDRAYLPQRSDLGQVFYPPRHFFANVLAEGEFALWNPHVYSGYPQFADPQAATFYPPSLLTAWVTQNEFSFATLALDIGFHFFLIGTFSFLFFRHLFKSDFPAFFSAILFEFGGYLTLYPVGQLSELEVAAWFPLTLLLVMLSIERKNWLLIALAGVAMGQVFLAGRPQSYLTIGTVTVTYLAFYGWERGLAWWRIGGKTAVLTAFALGIAAAQWIPTLELTRLTTRSQLTYSLVAEGGFPFSQLSGFFIPQLLGSQNLYVGLVALILAGAAAYYRKGMYWVTVFTVALFGSVGNHLILFDALYLFQRLGFPGYLRNVERLAFAMTFSLAVLAGYGIKMIWEGEEREPLKWVLWGSGILFSFILFLTWIWSIGQQEAFKPVLLTDTLIFVVLMLVGAILVTWIFKDQPLILAVALVSIAAVDVMSLNQGRFYVQAEDSFAPGNDIDLIGSAPAVDSPIYRIVFDQTHQQDYGSLLRVDNTGGLPPLMLIDYELLRGSLDDQYRRHQFLNVQMVVTGGTYTDEAYQLIKQEGDFGYYQFMPALPRAFLVEGVEEVPDSQTAADILLPWGFDYGRKALVVGETGLTEQVPLAPEETAVFVGRTANSITFQTTAVQDRFLVISETYYPGWYATIDGEPTEIFKTNVALRGVIVPPGTHTVHMEFRPTSFYMGVGLSLFTAFVSLGWGLWAWRKRAMNDE